MKSKNILYLIILSFSLSCGQSTSIEESHKSSKKVIIAGKILNYDKSSDKNVLTVYINDLGLSTQINYSTQIDSLGNFNLNFERYYPQDILISYKTNFWAIVHPGDSLNVEFEGNTDQRMEILNTIKFTGDASVLNNNLSDYYKRYSESPTIDQFIHSNRRDISPNKYLIFQDSIKKIRENQGNLFVKENSASQELKNWINSTIQSEYFKNLSRYPKRYQMAKGLETKLDINDDYYNFFNEFSPTVNMESLINSDVLWSLNVYYNHLFAIHRKNAGPMSLKNMDSLMIQKIIANPNESNFVKELLLTGQLNRSLTRFDISLYENSRDLISEYINSNFLSVPLETNYNKIKAPVLASELEVEEISDKSAVNIWAKILNEGKGKVIYIDCWATWCAPCIAEFPNSNDMIRNLKGENIEFVFLNFDSKEEQWKKAISIHEIKGKQYFLNKKQGAYFKELLKFSGFPNYIIINQKGQIVRNGHNYRPSNIISKEVINDLLNINKTL